jgi:glycosyltransferase involved in cell wall biosynthesis
MAVGTPVVANKTGSIPELIGDEERGWGIDYNYVYVDPWGNSNRYMADADSGLEQLQKLIANPDDRDKRVKAAREYVENRKWEPSVLQLEKAIEVVRGEK